MSRLIFQRLFVCASLAAAMLLPAAAGADIVTVSFVGEVSHITQGSTVTIGDGTDGQPTIAVGQAAVGSFTYDAATPASSVSSNGASYPGAWTGLSVSVNGGSFAYVANMSVTGAGVSIDVDGATSFTGSGFEHDPAGLTLPAGVLAPETLGMFPGFVFLSSDPTALSGVGLPTSLDLTKFDVSHQLRLTFGEALPDGGTIGAAEVFVRFDQITMTVAQVPEPATAAAGVLLALFIGQRPRRHAVAMA